MSLQPLYDPARGVLRVAGLMSGAGSNMRKVLEHQKELNDAVYQVVVIFSDCIKSNAAKIGKEFGIPVVVRDIKEFYRTQGMKRSNLSIRPQFDAETVLALKPYAAAVAAYGGYMSIASSVLIDSFLGVNVHPADLSIERNGKRVYTGDCAVVDAMNAGEAYIHASTHLVTTEVDGGSILMISKPVKVLTNQSPEENQNRLKEQGDWVIFPKTLEYIAQGRFARDQEGLLYFDNKPIRKGLRLTI